MRKIDICLSPDLLHLHQPAGKAVVVVDILRATSSMVTAFAHGIERIIPVATLEECRKLQIQGYITAAERDGKKAEGFDLGNSPFGFMDESLTGKTLAMTTTNGTLAISKCAEAEEVLIGAFLNLAALAEYLRRQPNPVLVLCAGWKGKANLEDTLFAGALAEELGGLWEYESDAPLMARMLYNSSKHNLRQTLNKSSHVHRLNRLDIDNDIDFCLKTSIYNTIPVLQGKALVKQSVPAWMSRNL